MLKSKSTIDPDAAFPDRKREPTDADLNEAVGAASPAIVTLFARLQTAAPKVSQAWQYSERSGWYRLSLLGKRRLLYLVPKRGDFRLMMILGGKAVASLKEGPHAREITELLKKAKRYPEGTAFSFDRKSDLKIITALLQAKLAH